MSSNRFRGFGKTDKVIKGKEDAVREKAHCVGKAKAGKGTAAAGCAVAANRIFMLSFLRAFHFSSPFNESDIGGAERGAPSGKSGVGSRKSPERETITIHLTDLYGTGRQQHRNNQKDPFPKR